MADPSTSLGGGVGTGPGNGDETGTVGSSTASPTSSLPAMSTTRSTAPHAAGEPTPGSSIPAAAGGPTSSIMSIMPITIAPAPTAMNSTTIPAFPTVLPTNSPTDSTSNDPSVPTTVESRSKASAGGIVGGIVVAMLAIAAIFAVFFVRRNRRKKAAESLTFDRSYFTKSAVKLDDEAVDATRSRSLHTDIMSERRVDVVRSPSISRIDQGQPPCFGGDFGQYTSEEMYGHDMGSSGPWAADVFQEQPNPSYSFSLGEGAPPHYPMSHTLPGENPFAVPMEDALAARV